MLEIILSISERLISEIFEIVGCMYEFHEKRTIERLSGLCERRYESIIHDQAFFRRKTMKKWTPTLRKTPHQRVWVEIDMRLGLYTFQQMAQGRYISHCAA